MRVLDLREDFLEEVVLLALDRRLAFLRVDLQALHRRAFSLRLVVEDFLLGLVVLAGSEIGGVQGGGGGDDEDRIARKEWHMRARALPEKQGAGAAQNTPNFWGVSSRERKAIAASKWTARSSSIWLAWHFDNAPTNH